MKTLVCAVLVLAAFPPAQDSEKKATLRRIERLAGTLDLEEYHRDVAKALAPLGADAYAAISVATSAPWSVVTTWSAGPDVAVIDVDTDPTLGELPVQLADAVCAKLVAALAGGRPEALEAGRTYRRQALFPRQMLQYLFEMEATKYPE